MKLKTKNGFPISKMHKILLSIIGYWHILFKSSANNNLRIQEIRRDNQGRALCVFRLSVLLVLLIAISASFNSIGSRAAEGSPTITSITPNFGPVAGETDVTIAGSNFLQAADSATSLLLHGDGAGASFVDSGLTPKTLSATGNVTQSAAQSKFGGKSLYFDGSGYVSTPASDDLNFGTGDFTIDFWVNQPDFQNGAQPRYLLSYGNLSGNGAEGFEIMTANPGYIAYDSNGNTQGFNSNAVLTVDTWNHVAVVRFSGVTTIYINGIAQGSGPNAGNISSTGLLGVGYCQWNGVRYLNGYIDELRISKGIARWTSNFEPPTSPHGQPGVSIGGTVAKNVQFINSTSLTATTPAHAAGATDVTVTNPDGQSATLSSGYTYNAAPAPAISSIDPSSGPIAGGTGVTITGSNFYNDIDSYTKALLHGDGNGNVFSDSSLANPKTVTSYGDSMQTASQSKFGGKSMYFDGNGDYLSLTNDADVQFGGNDFTIDFWIRPVTTTGELVSKRSDSDSSASAFTISAYVGQYIFAGAGAGWDASLTFGSVDVDVWTHVAVVRSGNNFYLFKNGVLGRTFASASSSIGVNSMPLEVGRNHVGTGWLNGYIDEFRVSKGIARWTSNFNSALPSAFLNQSTVLFGGVPVDLGSVTNGGTIITTTAPAHAAGAVDVTVANSDGQSATLSGGYTYNAAPDIVSILPISGSKVGGDAITVTGTGFYGNPSITLGGVAATSVNVVNSTTITAVTPAHNSGTVDVVVTNEDGQLDTFSGGFTFNEFAPTVSSIDPTSGPVSGGTDVTISGSNFSGGIDANTKLLLHGDGSGSSFADSSLDPKTIAANGNATQSATQSKFGDKSAYFDGSGDYLAIPDSDDWNFGTGDFTIDYFVYQKSYASSHFNQQMHLSQSSYPTAWWSLFTMNNNGTLYFEVNGIPVFQTAAGAIKLNTWQHVAVARKDGVTKLFIDGALMSNAADTNNYPNVAAPLRIGAQNTDIMWFDGYLDEVRISKGAARWTSDFTPLTSQYTLQPEVDFGGVQATDVSVTSATTIIAKTPAHAAGTVDVAVTNYDEQSDTLAGAFTYIAPPSVSGVNPSELTNNQNFSGIIVSGQGFQNGATVKFRKSGQSDIACTNVVFNDSSSLSCDADFQGAEPGSWNVEVTNADGQVGLGTELMNIAGEVTQIKFITPEYVIKPTIASQAIRIQLQDDAGRAASFSENIAVNLSKTSATGEFSLSRTSWNSVDSISFAPSETTKTVYYKDAALGSHTIGANENPAGNWTDASQAISVSDAAPFVWPFDDASDYEYDSDKIGISNSDANLVDLAAANPEIKNAISASLTYSGLNSFSEVLDYENEGTVKYQLSNDDGATWYWWNGASWEIATQGVNQSNDATTINAHIAQFNSQIGQIGNAKLSFRAFLVSDGSQNVSLDSIFVGYNLYPYKYELISKPDSLNETEIGTFVLQAQDQNGNVIVVDHDTVVSLGTSSPTTGSFAIDLNEDQSTRWDKNSVTIPAGQSSANFYYKDSQKGTPTISANPPGGESTQAINYPLEIISKYRFLVTGVSDPIKAGVPSSVTIQAVDYLGAFATDYVGTVHFASTDGAASLPSSSTLTAPMLGGKTFVNGVIMMTQAEQCVTVADIADPVITGSQCAITVTAPPAGVASKLKIISAPQYVPVSEVSQAITVQLQDINGDAATKATPTTVYVYRTTSSGQFSIDGAGGWTNGAFSVLIPAGITSANFFYKDDAIGNYNLTVSDDSIEGQDIGLANDSQSLSAVAGSPHSFSLDAPGPILAGVASGALKFSLNDILGNKVTTQNDQAAVITSSGGAEFSLDGVNNWTNKLITNIPAGSYENTFYYRNNQAGGDTITISDADPADGNTGLIDEVETVTVSALGVSQFVFLTSSMNVSIGEISQPVTVQARDVLGNATAVTSDTDVYLYSSSTSTLFSNSNSPFASVSKVTIPSGGSSTSFYFKQTEGTAPIMLTISDNAVSPDGNTGIHDAQQTQTVGQGQVTSFVITNASPYQLDANQESGLIRVESRNSFGINIPMSSDKTVYFHTDSDASVKEFSLEAAPSWENISSVTWEEGVEAMSFYYKDNKAGTKTISVGDDVNFGEDLDISNATLAVEVAPAEPYKLEIISNPLTIEAGERGQLTVEMQDEFGNQTSEDVDRIINLASDGENGVFVDANGAPITSLTIPAGNSTASFFYENDFAGSQNISVQTSGLLNDSQTLVVEAGAISNMALETASSDLVAGISSDQIKVQLYNSHGIKVPVQADLEISVTSSAATGRFDIGQNGDFSSSSLLPTISAGSSYATFYCKDTKAGDITLHANASGLNESMLGLHVQSAEADHLKFVSSSQLISAGEISNAISGKIYDQYENEAVSASDLVLNLSTSSDGGEFSLTNSPWSAVSSMNVASGQTSFSFFYKDQDAGVPTITVSSSYGNITQAESVISGPLLSDDPVKILFQSAPQTMIIDSPSSLNFYLANNSGQYTSASGQTIVTATSDSATGLFFDEASESWVAELDVTFETGESLKSIKYKDSASGNPTITLESPGLTAASQQQSVVNGNVEKIILSAPDSASTVDRIPVLIEMMTNSDLPVAVTSDVTINLHSGSGSFYASAVSQTPITSTVFPNGTSAKTVYFQKTTVGSVTISADENPSLGWTEGQKNIAISSVPTRLKISTPVQTKQAGQESDIFTVTLEDVYGNASNTDSDLVLHLSSVSQFGEFSLLSGDDWNQANSVIMAAGSGTASFYYKDTLAGAQTIIVSDVSSPAESPDTGYINVSQQYNVVAGSAYRFGFLSSQNNLEIGQASPQIAIQTYDQYGNTKIVDSDLSVYLYSTSASGKFSLSQNFSQADLVTSVIVRAGTSVATFYYRDLEANTAQITVSDKNPLDDSDVDILNASQQVTVVIGNVAAIAWESVPNVIEEGDGSFAITVKTTNSSGIEVPVLSDLPIYFSIKNSTASNGSFALDPEGPWGIGSTTLEAGTSRATFHYKDTIAGTPLITVSDEVSPQENFDSGLTNARSYITIVQGAISKIVFNSEQQTVIANHPSSIYQIQTLNKSDVPTNVGGNTLIYLRSSSTSGQFSQNGQDWGINGIIVPAGSSVASFYYRDATSGSYTLTAADTLPLATDINWNNAVQSVLIIPQQLNHFSVRNISDPQKQGTPSSVVVSPVDSENYVIKEYAGTITEIDVLDIDGNVEPAILPDVPYTFNPSVDKGIKTFVNAVAFYSEGEKTVRIKDSNGIVGLQENITVTQANVDPARQIRFIDPAEPMSVAKKTVSPLVTIQLQDASGNPTNVTDADGYDVKIVSSKGGEFSKNGTDWSPGEIVLNVRQYINFATFYYRNSDNVDDELTAIDWNGGIDDSSVGNDIFSVEVMAGQAEHLHLTGANVQVAGAQQNITITAKDADGDIATSYAGEKEIILTGAGNAYVGKVPTCTDKDGKDVKLGESVTLNFAEGKADCILKLYRKEIAEIKADDGTINTFGKSERNLLVNVSASDMDAKLSVLSAIPNPQNIGAPVVVSIMPKDVFGNVAGASSQQVELNVLGANNVSRKQFDYDAANGVYQVAYVAQNPGLDIISATLNGILIGQDSEGESDGKIHEIIEGEVASMPSACGYLDLNGGESGNNELVFDACISAGKSVKSADISKNNTKGTSVTQLQIEAKNSIDKNLSGKIKINSYQQKPSDMNLSAGYQNAEKYMPYVFLRARTDADSDGISNLALRVIVPSQWMISNSITDILAIGTYGEKEEMLAVEHKDSSSDYEVFEVAVERFPEYLVMLGQRQPSQAADVSENQSSSSESDSSSITENDIVDILTGPLDVIRQEMAVESVSDGDDSSSSSENMVSDVIAKLFNVDENRAAEITNILAIVSTGAAAASAGVATTASFPLLSYMLGGIRTATALPYRRKQKWGVVYDAQTGEPLGGALVIISDDNGKVKEMKNTDPSGFYSFLAPKGTYVIEVRKSGYVGIESAHIVSFETYYDNSYTPGENIVLEEEDIISVNIPMLKQEETIWQKVLNPATMTHTVFWAGFSFSAFALLVNPSHFNIAIMIFFIANFFINTFYKKSLKTGKVLSKDLKPIPFATVKVFDKIDGKMVARTIANEKGIYFIVVNEGEYIIEAQSGALKFTNEIILDKHCEIKEQIIME